MRQKKFRLPRLSRRARLARNLSLAAFLVIASWVLAGCPAWTSALWGSGLWRGRQSPEAHCSKSRGEEKP